MLTFPPSAKARHTAGSSRSQATSVSTALLATCSFRYWAVRSVKVLASSWRRSSKSCYTVFFLLFTNDSALSGLILGSCTPGRPETGC